MKRLKPLTALSMAVALLLAGTAAIDSFLALPGRLSEHEIHAAPAPPVVADSPSKLYKQAVKAIKKRDYDKAESKLLQLLQTEKLYQEPSGCSAWYQLGRTALLQADHFEALTRLREGFSEMQSASKTDWFLNYDLARVYAVSYGESFGQQVTDLFYDVLKHSTPREQPELWQRIVDETRFLFKQEEEKKQLGKLLGKKDSRLGRHLLRFFRREDPSPITPQNEFLVTFFQRSEEARKLYGTRATPTGFDARGEIHVRLGKPYSKLTDHSGVLGQVGYQVYPYEFWFYKHIDQTLYYTFVRPRGKSHYVLAPGAESVFGTFYKGRSTFGDRLVDRPGFRPSEVAATATSLRENLYVTLAGQHETFRERFNKLSELESSAEKLSYADNNFRAEDKQHTRRRDRMAPAVIYRVGEERKNLPISYSIARFRARDNKVRTEITYSVPYRFLKFEPAARGMRAKLVGQIGIFDPDYELIEGSPIEENLSVIASNLIGRGTSINQWNFALEPGEYNLFLSLEDTTGKRLGTIRTEFQVAPFPKTRLGLSDIQLASYIEPSEQESQFVKNDLLVVPLPARAVSKNKPLFIYFEIYNLTRDESGEARYQIDYKLSREKEKQTVLSKVFSSSGEQDLSITLTEERVSDRSSLVEHVSFDVSKLGAGDIVLQLRVTDQNSQQQVTSAIDFSVLDH
ncbi:MAG: GWxTD domain-containing protein [bacterium]